MMRVAFSTRRSDELSSDTNEQRDGHSFRNNDCNFSSATAVSMAIPHARELVPPPLPPPQFIPEISSGRDPGWQWANDPSASDFARPASVKPGSSLLGGFHRTASQERDTEGRASEHARRASSTSTITPPSRDVEMTNTRDGEAGATCLGHNFKGERRLERSTLQNLSQRYDKHLVSKIGGPNTPSKQALSASSNQDAAAQERERRNSLLPALSQVQESTRWLPSMSPSGAISPVVGPAWDSHGHTRHNSMQSEALRMLPEHQHHQEDFPMDDAVPRSEQEIFGSFRIGDKRRASSPPRDRDDPRRQAALRDAQPSRFHASHASLSSVSSCGGQRHGSLSSSVALSSVPSSATSYASGILSPMASSATESDMQSSTAAEIASLALHQRTASDITQLDPRSSPENRGHSRHGSRSTTITQGMYACECCPKKPKKFETEQELRAHESEKQYGCNYCPNRFKNKNEAERHQNSLHLRDHSWSCAALTNYEAAFHMASGGSDMDVCGYCGMEFSNPPNWKARFEHLTAGHKVGQCNQQKKFFRADHFRQHLKHTHDGTSGKWTNMLENACMKSEPRVPQQLEEPTTFATSTRAEYLAQPAS